MTNKQENIATLLSNLFNEARSNVGIEYIYTLVRIEGITMGIRDPLLDLKSKLQNTDIGESIEDTLTGYCSLADAESPFSLLANILYCILGKPYNVSPFHHLYTGQIIKNIKPSLAQIVREIINIAREAGKQPLVNLIEEAYPDDILSCCESGNHPSELEYFKKVFQKCKTFLSSLLEIYFSERLNFKKFPKFHKLPGFEVMELLTNDEYGLYGFNMYFSNGNKATFARHYDSTECINVIPDVPINFQVGLLDDLRHEWRVGEKRLYEVGLLGKYNNTGEWKPIVYPGKSEAIRTLEKDARSLSEDDDVQGTFFYMMCTGYRVIELVVRANIELPYKHSAFGNKFHLWKCSPTDDKQEHWLYDGWLELDSVDPEYIKSAIASIGIALNRMAFAYDAVVNWRVKYRMTTSHNFYLTPSEDDMHILDSLMEKFPTSDDAIILDSAIDWYNRAQVSRDPFAAFLCYYIAIESVALAIAEGKANYGLEQLKGSDSNEAYKIKCIQDKFTSLYSKDPIQFAKEAYLECYLSLRKETQKVTELIFGSGHNYINALFVKRDGYSLCDIRGRLAHGRVIPLDKDEEHLIRKRLNEIAEISKEFLTRVIFLLKPSDTITSWKGKHTVNLLFDDPRAIHFASHEKALKNTNWSIRPEWCE